MRSYLIILKNTQNNFLRSRLLRASIEANATIVCGNEIGEYAFIGAGAVVTKPVPAYALVVGNPAKHTGWISELGHKLNFDINGKATCSESGQEYSLDNNQVRRTQ